MALSDHLGCIVTGMDHGGTTFTLNLLKAHPNLFSGFECGLLFEPGVARRKYSKFIKKGWQIKDKKAIDQISQVPTNYAFQLLFNHSKLKKPDSKIIDKTPGYSEYWSTFLKSSEDVPIIVVKKNPYDQFCSWRKRGHKINEFVHIYNRRLVSPLKKLTPEQRKRVLVVDFSMLFTDPRLYVQNMLNHIGFPFDESVYTDAFFDSMIDQRKKIDYQKILPGRDIGIINTKIVRYM